MAARRAKHRVVIMVEEAASSRTVLWAKYWAKDRPLMVPELWALRRRFIGIPTIQPRPYTTQMGQNRAIFFFHRAG